MLAVLWHGTVDKQSKAGLQLNHAGNGLLRKEVMMQVDQQNQQRQMFGCDPDAFIDSVKSSFSYKMTFEVNPHTLEPLRCSVYDAYCFSDPDKNVNYIEYEDWSIKQIRAIEERHGIK